MPAGLSRRPLEWKPQGLRDGHSNYLIDLLNAELDQAGKATAVLGRECYILYVDILGFRASIASDQDQMFEKYRQAIDSIRSLVSARAVHIRPNASGTPTIESIGLHKLSPPVVFSDSIFIASKDAEEQSLVDLCHAANRLFRSLLSQGLAVKGGIAKGRLHWDPLNGIHLGQAIVEAYELAESFDNVGIAIHPALHSEFDVLGGPVEFRLRGGGTVSLFVPIGVHEKTMQIPSEACWKAFDALKAQARSKGALGPISKLESSQHIVDALLANVTNASGGRT